MNIDDPLRKSAENPKAMQQTSTRLTLLARDLQFTLASIKRLERIAVDRARRRNAGSDSNRP